MTDIQKLAEIKNAKKKKLPHFRPVKSGLIKRVSKSWRKPQGVENKIRRRRRGRAAMVRIGYSTPTALKGLTKDLKKPVFVINKAEIDAMTKDQCAVLQSTMGMKKKIELLQHIKQKDLTVLQIKDIEVHIKKLQDQFNERKKSRSQKKLRLKSKDIDKKKDTKKEDKQNQRVKKKKEEKVETKEQKRKEVETKEQKRKEVEKILIQKGNEQ